MHINLKNNLNKLKYLKPENEYSSKIMKKPHNWLNLAGALTIYIFQLKVYQEIAQLISRESRDS